MGPGTCGRGRGPNGHNRRAQTPERAPIWYKMIMKTAAALTLAALTITGCSGTPTPAETVTVTETVTAIETVTAAAPTVTITATVDTTSDMPADPTQGFLDANKREPWASKIIDVEQTGADSFRVRTSIVDPRGRDGSPEASEAIRICRATIEFAQAAGIEKPGVHVAEADDTVFVVFDYDETGVCVEY